MMSVYDTYGVLINSGLSDGCRARQAFILRHFEELGFLDVLYGGSSF